MTFQSQGVEFSGSSRRFSPKTRFAAHWLSRSLTFLFLVEVLKFFSLILVRQLLPQSRVKSWGKGFFALFSRWKKCGGQREQSSARVHAHSSSSELSTHQMPSRDDLWVQINTDDDRAYCWNRQERTSIGRCRLAYVRAG